jgi:hypothetical protein
MPALSSPLAYVQEHRAPVGKDNPFWEAQEQFSDWIETSLDTYRDVRDRASEILFHAVYGSPLVQALVGLKASDATPKRGPGNGAAHVALVDQRIDELRKQITEGGPREAVIRALLYIRTPDGVADERGFNLLRQMREQTGKGMDLAAFKRALRDQFFMLSLDEKGAVDAIPSMLDKDPDLAFRMADRLRQLIDVVSPRSPEAKARVGEMKALFDQFKAREASKDSDRKIEPERSGHAHAAGSKHH